MDRGVVTAIPSPALLDLGDVELEEAIEPLKEFLPVTESISVHAGGVKRGGRVGRIP